MNKLDKILYKRANKFPLIMAILNITPDSFSDSGIFFHKNIALDYAFQLIDNNIDIIDIGGESTKPGSKSVSEEEEIIRVIPIIEQIRKRDENIVISVDTTKYAVAKCALEAGADIINDISGLTFSENFAILASKHDAYLVIMHIKGNPQNMQISPEYDNVTEEVINFLNEQSTFAKSQGTTKIIVDPGIGFGKSYKHNIELLRNISELSNLNYPILLGISRKSFLGTMLGIKEPNDRDTATFLTHSLLINKKIDIIRVHNYKMALDFKKIYEEIYI